MFHNRNPYLSSITYNKPVEDRTQILDINLTEKPFWSRTRVLNIRTRSGPWEFHKSQKFGAGQAEVEPARVQSPTGDACWQPGANDASLNHHGSTHHHHCSLDLAQYSDWTWLTHKTGYYKILTNFKCTHLWKDTYNKLALQGTDEKQKKKILKRH